MPNPFMSDRTAHYLNQLWLIDAFDFKILDIQHPQAMDKHYIVKNIYFAELMFKLTGNSNYLPGVYD